MRFVDFLRMTVLLSAGAATALGAVTVAGASSKDEPALALALIGWWAIAAVVGLRSGRGNQTSPPIARLLAGARSSNALPEHRPGTILLNRLWPLLLVTIVPGALAFLAPQVPGIATGFAVIWSLAWRHQDRAVAAIEDRDGVRFYVRRTSPLRPMALERTPGFKAMMPKELGGAA